MKKRERKIIELFLENGRKAGLYDVCKWWLRIYPEDIFITVPKEIVAVRDLMKKILSKQNEREDNE